MTAGSDILVVIPCLNEEVHLPGLIDRLLADNSDHLIVVVDGGSHDRSRAIVADFAARFPNVQLMDNPDRIQSAGINRAVRTFGEGRRWLARVDAHCGYPDNYVSGLVETAEARDVISVVVPMVAAGKACFQTAVAAAQNSVLGTGGSAHRHLGAGRFVDHGHHALMSIAAFRQVGGYDEAMSHNEDAELDHRLGRIGRIWLEPKHHIIYYPRATATGLWRQYLSYGKGRSQTIRMHRLKPRLRQLIPVTIPIAFLLALLAPLWWPFALPLAAWASLSMAAGLVLGVRERSLCAMASGAAAIIMHMAWGLGFLVQRLFGKARRPAVASNDAP